MSKFRFFIFGCIFSLSVLNAIARQDISLKQVVKLNLLEGGGDMSNSVKEYEVANEKGVWKSYQFKDSLTKTFIKIISNEELVHLLKIINTKDTIIKMDQFNMQHHTLEH